MILGWLLLSYYCCVIVSLPSCLSLYCSVLLFYLCLGLVFRACLPMGLCHLYIHVCAINKLSLALMRNDSQFLRKFYLYL